MSTLMITGFGRCGTNTEGYTKLRMAAWAEVMS